jgi:hypothetical protein
MAFLQSLEVGLVYGSIVESHEEVGFVLLPVQCDQGI